MRKTIKIVGVGDRCQGVGRNNKPYDFTRIAFVFEQPWIKGYSAATCPVDQDCLGDYVPKVNDEKDVVFHQDFKTGSIFIDAIL